MKACSLLGQSGQEGTVWSARARDYTAPAAQLNVVLDAVFIDMMKRDQTLSKYFWFGLLEEDYTATATPQNVVLNAVFIDMM